MLRFIETFLECDEDGNEELLRAWFLQYQFDEDGLWDKNEKTSNAQPKRGRLLGGTPSWAYEAGIYVTSDGPQLLK